MRTLGILGGTFDPIHNGHLLLARAALTQCELDRVLLVPSGRPPHKTAYAPAQDRLAMSMIAAYRQEGVEVSALESTALSVSYMADTLAKLNDAYPGARLYMILGSDALAKLPMWKNAEKIREHCAGLICVSRAAGEIDRYRAQVEKIGLTIRELRMPTCDVSSSAVREGVALQTDVSAMTPVSDYIAQHALYGAGSCEMTERLRRSMSLSRFQHTLSVATTAVCLAYVHGEDPAKAHIAGLLHDCAKGLRYEDQLHWIEKGGIEVDAEEKSIPSICHAPAGVAVARAIYGVADPDVLSAIRWHTTGSAYMNRLDKVVYLADMIEPLRRPFPGLSLIRQTAYKNLDDAALLAAQTSADHILQGGRKLLRRTLDMLSAAKIEK